MWRQREGVAEMKEALAFCIGIDVTIALIIYVMSHQLLL